MTEYPPWLVGAATQFIAGEVGYYDEALREQAVDFLNVIFSARPGDESGRRVILAEPAEWVVVYHDGYHPAPVGAGDPVFRALPTPS